MVGGYAAEVSRPADLKRAVADALRSVQAGKTAILNVIMPGAARLR
jgi:hypothetical protein